MAGGRFAVLNLMKISAVVACCGVCVYVWLCGCSCKSCVCVCMCIYVYDTIEYGNSVYEDELFVFAGNYTS